jgi:uncharacterized membrane protein (UPF0127 family)
MIRPIHLAAICAAALALTARSDELESLETAFEQDVLIIETATQGCFKFDIYLAVSSNQQQRGLMFVRDLPPWSGMLFTYRRSGVRSMWMKNTYIPLDIVFARGDGSVSSVAANTEPLSLKSISAIEPVNYVLELNAGTAEKLGIDSGSRLILQQPD